MTDDSAILFPLLSCNSRAALTSSSRIDASNSCNLDCAFKLLNKPRVMPLHCSAQDPSITATSSVDQCKALAKLEYNVARKPSDTMFRKSAISEMAFCHMTQRWCKGLGRLPVDQSRGKPRLEMQNLEASEMGKVMVAVKRGENANVLQHHMSVNGSNRLFEKFPGQGAILTSGCLP